MTLRHNLLLLYPMMVALLMICDPTLRFSCLAFVTFGGSSNRRQPPATIGIQNLCLPILDTPSDPANQNRNPFISTVTSRRIPIGTTAPRALSRTTTTTKLGLHPTAGASLALVGSSLCGMQISRWFPSGGILGTLIAAAMCGNLLPFVPNKHVLYDLCFSLFLPGSLTLLLLAYQPPPKTQTKDSETKTIDQERSNPNSISACIRRIAVPFLITSVASLLGCWLSYQCALAFQWFGPSAGSNLNEKLARITTGCMSASYVGGSVNFISTARLVGAPADLLGSLVTADLFTMAIYFAFLSSSLDWDWLVSKFSSKKFRDTKNQMVENRTTTEKQQGTGQLESTLSSSAAAGGFRSVCLASIPLLISTFGIVRLANAFEGLVGRFVPGTACALIAIVAPLLNSLVQAKHFWTPFSKAATVWSDFFFLSFFASIGVEANLSSALSMGPACLLFSSNALLVHVLGTVFGCLLWKKVLTFVDRNASLDLEDVWIASNAAIGGPATAAAFCGRMKKRDPDKLRGRTISATVWGVVGYAIGTMVGVGMYRIV